MNPHAARAAVVEQTYLAGVEAKLGAARERLMPGASWQWTTLDEELRVRELMSEARVFDRDILARMPKNRSRVYTGSRRRWLLWQRPATVAIATTLSPLDECLVGDAPLSPIDAATLMNHVRGLKQREKVPHVIGVCSPSGFADDVTERSLRVSDVTLILVSPRADGTWQVQAADPGTAAAIRDLFDPEDAAGKRRRIQSFVDADRVGLLTGGLSAATVARRLGLDPADVARAFAEMAREDPALRTSRDKSDTLLYRGISTESEDITMSIVDRLREILGGEGNEARKVNALSERRSRLQHKRESLHEDLTALEKRESELLNEGRQTTSPAVKRRVATQIKQLRGDMDRLNTTSRMLGQQIDVISTHIHNLTLIQQGKSAKLPRTEELTADAVRAEEMLEQIADTASLADGLSTGTAEANMTDDELAILAELDGPAASAEKPASREPVDRSAETQPPEGEPPRREPEAG